jgi:ABC-2 type transport system permease protein
MRALALAREDIRLTLRDRSSIFWIFLAPVIWVYFFGFLSQSPDPSKLKISLTVVQQDDSARAASLLRLLEAEGFELTVIPPGQEWKPPADLVRAVTIPAGFGPAIERREKVTLPMVKGRDANAQGTFAAQVALHKAVMKLLSEEALGGLRPEDEVLKADVRWASTRKIPVGMEQTIPGNLVMFVLISTLTYGSALLARERTNGVLRRVASSPARRLEILAGKLLGRMAMAAVQTTVFLVIGTTLFRIGWGRDPAALALLLGTYIFCAGALGMLFGSIFKTGDAASSAGIVACMTMAALGGCWWPAEVMPSWMRTLSYAFPTGWAMNGLHELLSWGGALPDVLMHCAAIAAFGAGALWLAVRRLDFTT